MGIFSAMPSAFCAPSEEDQNVNVRGHIDWFNVMIVGKYLGSAGDLCNLTMVNKKYENILKNCHFNPVEISFKNELAIFSSIETYHAEKFKKRNFVYTFPDDNIKTLIYFPGSFNFIRLKKILKENKIIDGKGNYNEEWSYQLEINGGNAMNGCRIVFESGDKSIIFLFEPCIVGKLNSLGNYNNLLKKIYNLLGNPSKKNFELSEATIDLPAEFSIPDYVTSLEEEAFKNCTALKKVTISGSVTSIGKCAFNGCSNLKYINIPSSVTKIGEGAFYGCCSLTEIKIPSSVKSIGNSAFLACFGLSKIDIPNSVTSIGEGAFNGCELLKEVNISNSVTSIDDNVFNYCPWLDNVVIPESVTSIGEGAFSFCERLTNIIIPPSVTSIGTNAFSDCKHLTNITVPNSVTSIGEGLFEGCENLNHIEFNGKVYENEHSFRQAFKAYIKSHGA